MGAPDMWIRKWVAERLENLTVSGRRIPVVDYRLPQSEDAYILMTALDKDFPREDKCGRAWNVRLNVDIVTTFPGNSGSRLFAEQIQDEVLARCVEPKIEGFEVIDFYADFAPDFNYIDNIQTIFRKILIFNFKLR